MSLEMSQHLYAVTYVRSDKTGINFIVTVYRHLVRGTSVICVISWSLGVCSVVVSLVGHSVYVVWLCAAAD